MIQFVINVLSVDLNKLYYVLIPLCRFDLFFFAALAWPRPAQHSKQRYRTRTRMEFGQAQLATGMIR